MVKNRTPMTFKEINRSVIFLMLFIAIIMICSGCSKNDEVGPKKIVQSFFDCVKEGDVNGAVGCFTPDFQKKYKMAVSLGGIVSDYFTGVDVSPLLERILSVASLDAYQDVEFVIENVEFTDEEKEHAQVYVTVDGGGGDFPSEVVINTIKDDGEWYLEDPDFTDW